MHEIIGPMVHSKRRHGGATDAAPDQSPPREAPSKWLRRSLRSKIIRKCRILSTDPKVLNGTRALARSSTRSSSSPRQEGTPALKKSSSDQQEDTPAPKKSSRFRGVTKHRVTERFEAHLWDKDAYNFKQKKRGRQVYLGAYKEEDAAAKAYDLAALKYWGPGTLLNFKLEDYTEELKNMTEIPRGEFLASLRRNSSGFSRGVSKYRGVARHHQYGRWEARIGRVEGNKYIYLGTFSTEEEAAVAYDLAAIHYRGRSTPTNFDVSRYPLDVQGTQAKKRSMNYTSKRRTKRKLRKSPTPTTSEDEASSVDSQATESKLPTTNTDEGAHCDGAQTKYDNNEDIWTLEKPMLSEESMPMESLASICEGFDDDIENSIHGGNNFNPYDMEDVVKYFNDDEL